MALNSPARYTALFLLILVLKISTVGAMRTVQECAAILDGPFVNDQVDSVENLKGNETSPVAINCQLTCLNSPYYNGLFNRYIPAIAVADTESKFFKGILGTDTSTRLYQKIKYPERGSCAQANDTFRYSYEIYPTDGVKMNRMVVRCAVHYSPSSSLCLGEPIVVIQYADDQVGSGSWECNSSIIDYPPPTPTPTSEVCVCNDSTTYPQDTTTTQNTTNTTQDTPTTSVISGGLLGVSLGASLGTVLPVIVIAVLLLVLLLVAVAYKQKRSTKITFISKDQSIDEATQTIANPSTSTLAQS